MESTNNINKSEKLRNDSRYENEGLVRVEIDLDLKTYVYLLKLVEESGYEIDTDVNKRQAPNTKSGITGVITQGIVELYEKYIKADNRDLDLDKRQQQSYIAENRIYGMTKSRAFDKNKSKMSNNEILKRLRPKIPDYIEIDENLEVKFKGHTKKSSKNLPDFRKPKISEPMKRDLEKKKLHHFISLTKANHTPKDE